MSEKIKYICQTEVRKFLEKNSREKQREREMKIQSACGPWFFKSLIRRGQKKLCLRCSFFFKGKSIKFFF